MIEADQRKLMSEVTGLLTSSGTHVYNTVIWMTWGIALYRQEGLTEDVTFDLGLDKRKGPAMQKLEKNLPGIFETRATEE